jgi:glutamyl-tRNA reductase
LVATQETGRELKTQTGIIGTSIWQQNQALLENLTLPRENRAKELERLKQALKIDELVYLSTCNRVEFIYSVSGNHGNEKLLHRLLDYFFRSGRSVPFFPNDLYHFTGREALLHLFRTASSLESLVIGETQITGQLKQAFDESREYQLSGSNLESIVAEALTTARRVKRETAIGEGSLSMASLAAGALQTHFEDASDLVIALVGAGEMTRKLAAYFSKKQLGKIIFTNRTAEKAGLLAEQFGGVAMPLQSFLSTPPPVDAIISATSSAEAVLDAPFLQRLQPRSRRVFCVDLAIPRDFSAEFGNDPKVIFVDIPALKARSEGNLRQKFVEANKANEIVRDAVNQYMADRFEVRLKPLFHASYQESLQFAQRSLNSLFDKKLTSLNESERDALVKLVTKLVSHSSFQPVKLLSAHLTQTQTEIDVNMTPEVRG